jgi:hypothetical protein
VVQGYGEEDYLVFDCPGQIELYNHLSVFKTFVDFLKQARGWMTLPAKECHAAGLARPRLSCPLLAYSALQSWTALLQSLQH